MKKKLITRKKMSLKTGKIATFSITEEEEIADIIKCAIQLVKQRPWLYTDTKVWLKNDYNFDLDTIK